MANAYLDPGRTTLDLEEEPLVRARGVERQLSLVVLWWRGEPSRVGEVLLPGTAPACFGRDGTEEVGELRLRLVRQRPGKNERTPQLVNPFLSRRQLLIRRGGEASALLLECLGKRGLSVNGVERDRAEVCAGDLVEIRRVGCLMCVERPAQLPPAARLHVFAEADSDSIVGESPAAWALRQRVAFAASRNAHVLITGPSGAGKELVARAIHQGSTRRRKALVARNAATIPPTLADAELFGNAPHYPNAGMTERPGLIGQADGSTLFLDEMGELPLDVQAHLLRVLDGGEYQRLGDARPRVADVRFIAATNRSVAELKPDLAARFALHVQVPGLEQRSEDLPLLARHLVRNIAGRDAAVGERFLEGWDGATGEPRFSSGLMTAISTHQYSTHVRELASLLWISMQSSPAGELECTDEVSKAIRLPIRGRDPDAVSREELHAALDRNEGMKERVWRELGLSSRHALTRLMRKLGEV
jgi:two-component system response regulator HydG